MRRALFVSIAMMAACGRLPEPGTASAPEPLVVTEGATLTAPFADLTPPDTTLGMFAWSIALTPDGSRLVVGSRFEPYAGTQSSGAVRIFRRSAGAWVHEQTLRAPTPMLGDFFGTSVAITPDASRLVVGFPGADTAQGVNAGAVRVYTRSGTVWSLETVLPDPDGFGSHGLGSTVAISANGTRIAAAASGAAGNGVRTWRRPTTTWTYEGALAVRNPSMAMSSDGLRLVLGFPSDATRGTGAGSVSVHARVGTAWSREAQLFAPDAAVDDAFGSAVAISDDGSLVLVGASGDDVGPVRDAGSVRSFVRTGTSWAYESELDAVDPADGDALGSTVALVGDGSRALVTARRDDVDTRTDVGSVRVFFHSGDRWSDEATLLSSDVGPSDGYGLSLAVDATGTLALVGAPFDTVFAGSSADGSVREYALARTADGGRCGVDTACASGFCVDGVCCATACGGNAADDCQACSAALTGGADGTCAPLSAAVAATVTCRASADACDAPDTCMAGSTACPADGFAAAGVECRPRTDACDRPETCTGTSAVCPPDAGLEPAGVVCRPALPGTCDAEETCTGTSASCPADGVLPSGSTCRPSIGSCDLDEVCDGLSFACPGDVVAAAGMICRPRAGTCDVEETCTGTAGSCPADVVRAAGTVCALRGTAPCDVDDVCDGASGTCPPTFAPAGTECAPSGGGICDAPDLCTGGSADCMPTYAAGVVCRPSTGACDPDETCTGGAASCPMDVVLPAGRSCRASTSTTCDPEEVCDGLTGSCPIDVSTCEPVDAGTDAGSARPDGGASDAGASGLDAATGSPPGTAGCGCSLAPRAPTGLFAFASSAAIVLRVRRRRR